MLSFVPMPALMLDAMMADTQDTFAATPFARMRHAPPALAKQEDGSYALALSAPGVKPEDLKVSVTDGVLEVEGETKTASGTHSIRWAARVPRDADPDAITADSRDGIVSLTLPKKPEAAPLKITVATTAAEEEEEADEAPRYSLTIAVPGLAAADVDVSVADLVLRVKGETKRTGARVAKTVRLPRDADVDEATASLVDGLLSLTVPKKPAADAKTVAVNGGASAADDFEMVA